MPEGAFQLVGKVLADFPAKLKKISTRKKTLTVFFHTFFPSDSFGRNGFLTVWAGKKFPGLLQEHFTREKTLDIIESDFMEMSGSNYAAI